MLEDTEFQAFLSAYDPKIREVAARVRQLVFQHMPKVQERIEYGHKAINYSSGKKMKDTIFYIAPFKNHVNLGFMRGTSLTDPSNLLEGTGKNLRHVKLKDPMDTTDARLHELVSAAVHAATRENPKP